MGHLQNTLVKKNDRVDTLELGVSGSLPVYPMDTSLSLLRDFRF